MLPSSSRQYVNCSSSLMVYSTIENIYYLADISGLLVNHSVLHHPKSAVRCHFPKLNVISSVERRHSLLSLSLFLRKRVDYANFQLILVESYVSGKLTLVVLKYVIQVLFQSDSQKWVSIIR